eukprot:CAMPEP_0118640950 /NCGR_PEP_ID=MMETSP0785-20121206/5019_1 /TAXON_ID=91992 /ORGANISM="Bolidomonas pacifica, Strain CCMP 1866" /LENGTH=64 /DNA_ID=CAMNT_0006532357 /DNA_START=59 /DNA_END=252 /DNA_ORIENTATION=+
MFNDDTNTCVPLNISPQHVFAPFDNARNRPLILALRRLLNRRKEPCLDAPVQPNPATPAGGGEY